MSTGSPMHPGRFGACRAKQSVSGGTNDFERVTGSTKSIPPENGFKVQATRALALSKMDDLFWMPETTTIPW